jgi:signal transduction histidine kinase
MPQARVAETPPLRDDEAELRAQVLRLQARVAELEAAVRRSEDVTSTVFAMLSHELRSPLQSLILNVAICIERLSLPGGETPPWLTDKLEKQRRLAARLKALIDTFLSVGQIAAGHLHLEPELVDLGEVVREVVGRVADDLAWAGCPVTLEAPEEVCGIWDRLQLDLVVTNLLSNAMKYGAGRPIEIQVGGTPDVAWLRVQDHGPGIDGADHRRIFEKFTRLGAPSRVSGFGLGLWIVRHIVEASRGRIEVASDPGQGAAFLVSLPRSG